MRLMISMLALLVAASACRPQSRTAAADPKLPSPPASAASCEAPELHDRLSRLHELAVADHALPEHLAAELNDRLDGLMPIGSTTAAPAFVVPARSISTAPVVHHAPRFEGEEVPSALHLDLEPLADASSRRLRRALANEIDGQNRVGLALWAGTSGREVANVLDALERSGVTEVDILGRQNIPALADIDAPAKAKARLSELVRPDNAIELARARATMELERIVFDAANHDVDFTGRIMAATGDFAERSAAYIAFLEREQARAGCTIPPGHLEWLYRARFLADAPVGVLPVRLERTADGLGFSADETWAAVTQRYVELFGKSSDQRVRMPVGELAQ